MFYKWFFNKMYKKLFELNDFIDTLEHSQRTVMATVLCRMMGREEEAFLSSRGTRWKRWSSCWYCILFSVLGGKKNYIPYNYNTVTTLFLYKSQILFIVSDFWTNSTISNSRSFIHIALLGAFTNRKKNKKTPTTDSFNVTEVINLDLRY